MPPSVWLYLAGLVVTLSGLLCRLLRPGIAARIALCPVQAWQYGRLWLSVMSCGAEGFSLHFLQTPAAAGTFGLLIAIAASNRHGFESLLPADAARRPGQIMANGYCMGRSISCSFALNNDASVPVFLCAEYDPDRTGQHLCAGQRNGECVPCFRGRRPLF